MLQRFPYEDDELYFRRNFDNFGRAMLTMFQVSTGEDWNRVLWQFMDNRVRFWWFTPIFLSFFFIFSNYIVLNLIIAVILENTELLDIDKKRLQKAEHIKFLQKKKKPRRVEGIAGFFDRMRTLIKGRSAKVVQDTEVLTKGSKPGPVTESMVHELG